MKSVILSIFLFSQMALASDQIFVEIKSFKNGEPWGNPRIITLLDQAAEVEMKNKNTLSKQSVLITQIKNQLHVKYNIIEKNQDVDLKVEENYSLGLSGGEKKFSYKPNSDEYTYQISIKK